ncbi:Ubiquitin-conjugating enzyme E2 36 [Platanthera zijinensis]|uniref:Ubiquitin-conjugating enzyme E2 36 n=1 Tax=Platanthera zijinensis TaxID=2320716 RepID=A0AAP0AU90_9ASPA
MHKSSTSSNGSSEGYGGKGEVGSRRDLEENKSHSSQKLGEERIGGRRFMIFGENLGRIDGFRAPGNSAFPSEENMCYFNVMILGIWQSPYEVQQIYRRGGKNQNCKRGGNGTRMPEADGREKAERIEKKARVLQSMKEQGLAAPGKASNLSRLTKLPGNNAWQQQQGRLPASPTALIRAVVKRL